MASVVGVKGGRAKLAVVRDVGKSAVEFRKDNGGSNTFKDYVRFQLSEGMKKEESEVATEGTAAAGG